jgi:hypothetical protein
MNVKIGNEVAQFPEKEYINQMGFSLQCMWFLNREKSYRETMRTVAQVLKNRKSCMTLRIWSSCAKASASEIVVGADATRAAPPNS